MRWKLICIHCGQHSNLCYCVCLCVGVGVGLAGWVFVKRCVYVRALLAGCVYVFVCWCVCVRSSLCFMNEFMYTCKIFAYL